MPKKFQLDLSRPGRRNDREDLAPEDVEAEVDSVPEKDESALPTSSFRARLAKKIAEDEAPASLPVKEPIASRRPPSYGLLGKFKKGKLDLRNIGVVPPPREVVDDDDEVVNYDPGILRLESSSRVASREEEVEAVPPAVPVKKKKRRRKKKKTVAAAAPAVVAQQAAPSPVLGELLAVPPLNLPLAPDNSESALADVSVAAAPVAAPAAPIKKKKRRKKRPPVAAKPNQEVPIKIIEGIEEEGVVSEDKRPVAGVVDEAQRPSFRQSLEDRVAGKRTAIDNGASDGFREKVLENGLRVIFAPMAGTKTITALVMFGTGSKYESLSQNGLSHFLEHMFFKGTKNRPNAQRISSELDALGSEYNAFTSKEYTGYWIKVDAAKADSALDILSDMLLNSKFSDKEIDKERGVIIEEINMYHENPLMYIEDVFEKCLYGETPAGREIIGPKENIAAFKRQNFMDYFSTQYGSNAATLVVSGAVNGDIEDAVSRYFENMVKRPFKDKLRTPDNQLGSQVKVHYQEGKQSNISLGVRTYDTYHPDKIILKVLSVVLGGSMSSRLFNEVREKRGLAYYVRTQNEFFTDTGYLTTQAGVPAEKVGEAVETIVAEYKKIAEEPVSDEELSRAKDLIRGRTVIAFEESDSVANWYARQSVLGEEVVTPEQFFEMIASVTPEDIMRVAADIFKQNKLNLAVIGPFKGGVQFEKHLKFKKKAIIPGIFGFFA